jgi:hypothetical protein
VDEVKNSRGSWPELSVLQFLVHTVRVPVL